MRLSLGVAKVAKVRRKAFALLRQTGHLCQTEQMWFSAFVPLQEQPEVVFRPCVKLDLWLSAAMPREPRLAYQNQYCSHVVQLVGRVVYYYNFQNNCTLRFI